MSISMQNNFFIRWSDDCYQEIHKDHEKDDIADNEKDECKDNDWLCMKVLIGFRVF